MHNMRITIVADVLGQENNGTTITCKRLIENLKMRGHEVKVVSPLKTDLEGYYTLKTRSFGPFNNYVAKNGVELAKPDDKIILEAIKGADVCHILLPFKTGIRAMKLCKKEGIPVTGAFHCQPENFSVHLKLEKSKLFNKFLYHRFYKKFYKYVKYVHCPSEFIARKLRENHYDNCLEVISNGVAPGYVKKAVSKPENLRDKICIVTVGRLSHEKRHDLLIKAVSYSKYKDKIQVLICGRGPIENETKKLGKILPNKPIIGFYKQEELVDILNYSDIYCHPADVEIEAIACLEAITCGLVPIISDSSNSATNSFALEDIDLFKAGDALDLSKKIDYLIEHPEEKECLSQKYLEYSKKFAISHCIDLIEEMFKKAICDYGKEK